MTEPTDYAALQKEMSERVQQFECEDKCEWVSYHELYQRYGDAVRCPEGESISPALKSDGYEHSSTRAGVVKRCADCKAKAAPRTWIADIPHERFVQWMNEPERNAFTLDSMRVLLPESHAMFERRCDCGIPYSAGCREHATGPFAGPCAAMRGEPIGVANMDEHKYNFPVVLTLEDARKTSWVTTSHVLGDIPAPPPDVVKAGNEMRRMPPPIGPVPTCAKCKLSYADCMCGGFGLL